MPPITKPRTAWAARTSCVAGWPGGNRHGLGGRTAALAAVTSVFPPTGGAHAGGCGWVLGSTRGDGGDGDDGGGGGAGGTSAVRRRCVPLPSDRPGPAFGMTGTCEQSSRAEISIPPVVFQRGCTRTELPADLSSLKSQIGGRPSQALRSSWPWFLGRGPVMVVGLRPRVQENSDQARAHHKLCLLRLHRKYEGCP